jgi:PAS domain-containing protein
MLSPITIENKHYISATIRDITNQKLTDEKLQRFNFALTATSDAIWEWDFKTYKTFYSARWFEMYLGCRGPESLRWILRIGENYATLTAAQMTVDAIFTELLKPDCQGTNAEVRMKHEDGSWVWILARGNVVKKNEDGKYRTY